MKWLSRLFSNGERLSSIEQKMVNIEKRLQMLECGHGDFKFEKYTYYIFGNYATYYSKKCGKCGKVMWDTIDKKEWLKEQFCDLQEKIDKNDSV